MAFVVRDPTYSPPAVASWLETWASRAICDPRDLPFLRLTMLLSATVIPTGIGLYFGPFNWPLAVAHTALVLYFFGPLTLMLHNTSHRKLFRRPWRAMNLFIPWVVGPFFGQSPEAYFAHHVGMHHAENNLEDDLSSTLPYRRDSVLDFACYFLHFFFLGGFELARYLKNKGRRTLMARLLVGEGLFLAMVAALCLVSWPATLVVFVIPLVVVRFAMMAGNWAQHAFVDEAAPANNYRNSITCINSSYNRRCFNDGYHIGHHLKATRHWTELPVEFSRNLTAYEREQALVFEGIDFFGVWLRLMAGRYDLLARRFVALGTSRPSDGDIEKLLRARSQWTNRHPLRVGAARTP